MVEEEIFEIFKKLNFGEEIEIKDFDAKDIKELLMRAFLFGGTWNATHQWMPYDEGICELVEDGELCVIDVWDDESEERLGLTIAPLCDGMFPLPEGQSVTHYMRIPLREGMSMNEK